MKKYFIPLLLISILSAYSYYSTPGNGRNWNLDSLVLYSSGHIIFTNGYYQINDTFTISQSDTIFILNNSIIKCSSLTLINIAGTLLIDPPTQVMITALDTNQKYIGLNFSQNSGASVLRKTIFEYGNGIKIINSNIIIDSCIIRYFTLVNNFSSGAISVSNATPTISNCQIYRNRRSGILSSANGNASPQIINNNIFENNTENLSAWNQINLGTSASTPIIIRGNIIRGLYNQAGGISISTLIGGSIQNCIIENNLITNNRYGIAVYGNNINAFIYSNVIDSNNTLPNPILGGSGINFNGNSTQTAIVKRNKIRWNLWGITIQTSAKPNLGNINNSDTSDDGYNYLYRNIHSDSIIDLYNNTPDSIMAQNNYWGTMNLDSIELHIVHKPDITSLGFVNYIPLYNPIGIIKRNIDFPLNYKLCDAYPNPFNPSTKIRFEIPQTETSYNLYASVKIYDIQGKLILILFNGKVKPGNYEYEFNSKNINNQTYSSGIYFYKLDIISDKSNLLYMKTKKLILIK